MANCVYCSICGKSVSNRLGLDQDLVVRANVLNA